MSYWSDYFESILEDNSASCVTGKFEVAGSKISRAEGNKLLSVDADGHAEIKKILADAWQAEKEKFLYLIESCPQCGLSELHTYKIKNKYFLSECQDCGIYGKGEEHHDALKAIEDAFGEGLDWRYNPLPPGRL